MRREKEKVSVCAVQASLVQAKQASSKQPTLPVNFEAGRSKVHGDEATGLDWRWRLAETRTYPSCISRQQHGGHD